MIAVVPARGGEAVAGAEEAVAEAGGRVLVAGEGAAAAAGRLAAEPGLVAGEAAAVELGSFQPGRWARALAPLVEEGVAVVVPGSPDGRDLGPRLAHELGRPFLGAALAVDEHGATVVWRHGSVTARLDAAGPFVAALLPGSRSVVPSGRRSEGATVRELPPSGGDAEPGADAVVLEVLEADPAVMDLAESSRILAGGAGLGGAEEFARLQHVAGLVHASVGGTRVVTDAGLLPHDRQIGTTGVSVRPRCYVALGISGAAQHLGGVVADRVVSVNLDPSCPMMAVADLALVADAAAVLAAVEARLAVSAAGGGG